MWQLIFNLTPGRLIRSNWSWANKLYLTIARKALNEVENDALIYGLTDKVELLIVGGRPMLHSLQTGASLALNALEDVADLACALEELIVKQSDDWGISNKRRNDKCV